MASWLSWFHDVLAKLNAQGKRKRSRTQQAQRKSKRGKIMQAQGKGKSGELLQLSFDKGGIQPWSSSTAAIAMVGSGSETPSRSARRQEEWPRSKARFDTDEAPRRRKPTSHPLQKRKRSDGDPGGPQTKRFGAEHCVRREQPTGAVNYYEGKAGAEHLVRTRRCLSHGDVVTYACTNHSKN